MFETDLPKIVTKEILPTSTAPDGATQITVANQYRKMSKRNFLSLFGKLGLVAAGATANEGLHRIIGNHEQLAADMTETKGYHPANRELIEKYRAIDQNNTVAAQRMIEEINANETSPLFYEAFMEEFIRQNTYEQIIELIEEAELAGKSMYDIITQLVPLAGQYELIENMINNPDNSGQYKAERKKVLGYISRLQQVPLTNTVQVDANGEVNPNAMGLAVKYYFDTDTILNYLNKANQGDRKLDSSVQARLMQTPQYNNV